MMKMLIELNNELIENDGYSIEMIWTEIDKIFATSNCTKEVLNNGAVYSGDPNKKSHFIDFFKPFATLSTCEWFRKYAVKWTFFDNDGRESMPYHEDDLLDAAIKRVKLRK